MQNQISDHHAQQVIAAWQHLARAAGHLADWDQRHDSTELAVGQAAGHARAEIQHLRAWCDTMLRGLEAEITDHEVEAQAVFDDVQGLLDDVLSEDGAS